jgi:hypothetical protein
MRTPRQSNYRRGKSGVPAWLLLVVTIAVVMGGFYLWEGLQRFVRTGGLGIPESTARAQLIATQTAEDATLQLALRTPIPSSTPLPQCQDFRVSVNAANAIVREAPFSNAPIVEAYDNGTIVCVLWRDEGSEYWTIDANPTTRRRELAYMHESVLVSVNPTPTQGPTFTPLPTVTALPVTPTPALLQPATPRSTPTPQVTEASDASSAG